MKTTVQRQTYLQTKIRLYNYRMLILPQILLPQEDFSIDSEVHSWKGCKAQVLQQKAKIEKGDKTITLGQFLKPAIPPYNWMRLPLNKEITLSLSLSHLCIYTHILIHINTHMYIYSQLCNIFCVHVWRILMNTLGTEYEWVFLFNSITVTLLGFALASNISFL